MTVSKILFLAMLLVAAVSASVAPSHPGYADEDDNIVWGT